MKNEETGTESRSENTNNYDVLFINELLRLFPFQNCQGFSTVLVLKNSLLVTIEELLESQLFNFCL